MRGDLQRKHLLHLGADHQHIVQAGVYGEPCQTVSNSPSDSVASGMAANLSGDPDSYETLTFGRYEAKTRSLLPEPGLKYFLKSSLVGAP